jgi:hypothetical protein
MLRFNRKEVKKHLVTSKKLPKPNARLQPLSSFSFYAKTLQEKLMR